MRIFGRDKNVRAAEDRRPSDNPQKNTVAAFANRGTVIPVTRGVNPYTKEQAQKHTIIYRCLDKIGTAVQSVSWYVEKVPGTTGATKEQIRAVESVLNSPNYSMSGAQLRYWMGMQMALTARVPLKFGAALDGPNAIWPLQEGLLKAVTDNFGNVISYKYGDKEATKASPSWNSVVKSARGQPTESFIAEIMKPSITGKLEDAMSPLAALALPSDVTSTLFRRAQDVAAGQPNLRKIIMLDENTSADQFDGVVDTLDTSKAGEENSGRFLVVTGKSMDVKDIDQDMSDIHSKIPLDDMARNILGIFGIPVALAGLASADGSKFASNYIESRLSFFEDTIIPGYLVPFEEELTRYMCPSNLRIRFDRDTIPALQASRITNAKNLQGVTFLTDDEKRELCGFNPRGDVNV